VHIAILGILAMVLATGCGDRPPPVTGCAAVGDLVPVCGLSRPEDMELLPDGHTMVISQMGTLDGAEAGSLALYDTATGIITGLPPFTEPPAQRWGAGNRSRLARLRDPAPGQFPQRRRGAAGGRFSRNQYVRP